MAGATLCFFDIRSPTLVDLESPDRSKATVSLNPKTRPVSRRREAAEGACRTGPKRADPGDGNLAGLAQLVVAGYLIRVQGHIGREVDGDAMLEKAGAAVAVHPLLSLVVMAVLRSGVIDGTFIPPRDRARLVTPVAVGFDLDDTLCVPRRDRATLLEEAVAAVDAPPLTEWASRASYRAAHRDHLTGETRAPVFDALLDGTSADIDGNRLARAYRETVNAALDPVPGVEALLAALRAECRVGLLTNGPRRAQWSKLESLGWTDAFDAVFVSGELPAGKPDPRAFQALLEGLDVAPGELIYVGDDVDADIGGATAVGCRTVQVLHVDGPAPDPRADATVPVGALADELPGTLTALTG